MLTEGVWFFALKIVSTLLIKPWKERILQLYAQLGIDLQ